MTWHSIFDFSTMEERHLVASYTVVFIVQGFFLASILWGWRSLRTPRN